MSTTETPVKGSFRGLSDVPLVARQVGFEQLSFWLNPIGAVMTIGFSLVFIVIFVSTSRHSTVNYLSVDLGPVLRPGVRRVRGDGRLLQHPRHHHGQPA